MSGAESVVGVLAKNDYGDFVKVRSEGVKDQLFAGEDGLGLVFGMKKIAQFFEIRFGEFGLEERLPTLVHIIIIIAPLDKNGKKVYNKRDRGNKAPYLVP